MQTIHLNDQLDLPVLGLGTWLLTGNTCSEAVKMAIEIGYRHIDTAEKYGNQAEIGKALSEISLDRSEYYLTSKLWMNHYHTSQVRPAFEQTLADLRTDYIDLYLMHWPDRTIPFTETLIELQKIKEEGLIKAIGISNCTMHHVEEILSAGIEIVTNQVELHPSFSQSELQIFCQKHDVVMTAYSPLGRGADLKLPIIVELAQKHEVSTAAVILNWLRQKGIIAIPKASDYKHLEDNFNSLKWDLSTDDVVKISSLNTNNRVINPDCGDFDY